MNLEGLSEILFRVCASSLLTCIFFGILWIIVYALEKAILIKIVGYIALVWLLLAFASGFLALICYIWSDVFD